MPKPIKRTFAQVVSELQTHVMAWKQTHRLDDTQVTTILAMLAGHHAQNSYVRLSEADGYVDR